MRKGERADRPAQLIIYITLICIIHIYNHFFLSLPILDFFSIWVLSNINIVMLLNRGLACGNMIEACQPCAFLT